MKKSFRVLLIALVVLLTVGLFGIAAQASDTAATLKDQAAPDASKIKLNLKTDELTGMNEKMEWMDATSEKPAADSAGTGCSKTLKLADIGMTTNADGNKKIAFRFKATTTAKASPWTTISIKAIPAKPNVVAMNAASKPKTSIYVDWNKEVFVNVTDKYEYQLSTKAGKWNKHKGSKTDAVNLDLSKFAKVETTISVRVKGDASSMLPNGEPSDPITLLARPAKLGKTVPTINTTTESLSLPGIDEEATWQYTLTPKEKNNPVFISGLNGLTTGLRNTEEIDLNAVEPLKGKTVNLIQDKSASLGVRIMYSFADDGMSGRFSSPMLAVKIPVRAKTPKLKYDFTKEAFAGKGKLQYYLVEPAEFNAAVVDAEKNTDLKANITKPVAVTGKVITTLPAVSLAEIVDGEYGLADESAYPIKKFTKANDEMKGKLEGFAEANGNVPAPAASDINLVYRVRTGPTDKAFASAYESFTVSKRAAPTAVSATLDYATERLTGSNTLEYVLDLVATVDAVTKTFTVAIDSDASWAQFDKKNPSVAVDVPDYNETAAYNAAAVRIKATKTTVKSEVLPILIPMRSKAPTKATIDYAKEELSFTEVATTLEYSLNDGKTYIPIADKNVDAATKKVMNLSSAANKILTDKSGDQTMTYRVKAVAPNAKANPPITPVESRFKSETEETEIPARPILTVELEAGEMGQWSVPTFSVEGPTLTDNELKAKVLYSKDAITADTDTTVTGGDTPLDPMLKALATTSQVINFKLPSDNASESKYFASAPIKATFKKTQKGKLTLEKDSGVLKNAACDIEIIINNGDGVVVADGNVKLYALKGGTLPTGSGGTGTVVDVTAGKVTLAAATYATADATSSTVSFILVDETADMPKVMLAEGTLTIPHVVQATPADTVVATLSVGNEDGKISNTGTVPEGSTLEYSVDNGGKWNDFTSGTSTVNPEKANSTLRFRYKATGFGKASDALIYDVTYTAATESYAVSPR